MKKPIHFVKMHGAGNDYIFVDTTRHTIPDPAAAARAWSDRHTGIGSDGLVLIGRPTDPSAADFTMRIFNADGSEGLMCGNAARCIGKLVYERGMTRSTHVRLLTASGIKTLDLDVTGDGTVRTVTVDMGTPTFNDSSLYSPTATPRPSRAATVPPAPGQPHALPDGVFVSMGNPHYVIFVDDLSAIDVATRGPILERHPNFPQRCNIEFAQIISRDTLRMRVWERGSGITMACGTGACAAAVAAALTGHTHRHATVIMDGGTLTANWREADGHVHLSGPATIAFEGAITP